MADRGQVIRFAVGSALGPRSRTWRLWVPTGKSDVYVSGRRVGNSVKVSLHEPGPSRFALTSEFVRTETFDIPDDADPRLAKEWERPRPSNEHPVVRPFAIIVPWDEVRVRDTNESGRVVWTTPPPKGHSVHFDVIYVAPGTPVTGHPGARAMGSQFVGEVLLPSGVRVFVTSRVVELEPKSLKVLEMLRSVRVHDAKGDPVQRLGVLSFGVEPNADANDGTSVGMLTDVSLPDEPQADDGG